MANVHHSLSIIVYIFSSLRWPYICLSSPLFGHLNSALTILHRISYMFQRATSEGVYAVHLASVPSASTMCSGTITLLYWQPNCKASDMGSLDIGVKYSYCS